MASKRYLTTLIRQSSSLLFSNPRSLYSLKTLTPNFYPIQRFPQIFNLNFDLNRTFSSIPRNPNSHNFVDDETESSDGEDDEIEITDDEDDEMIEGGGGVIVSRAYSIEEKIAEADHIGYQVIGPLKSDDRVFKPYQPVFAIVQIGSHQFKVSNGDAIYVEKLKFCEVNDKLCLTKVLMVGSSTQTIIGRPILPDATVHAVVEEHALDAKVIIFKKKRRKNYRRTNGHRQELTRLRITDIEGVEKPEIPPVEKKTPKKSSSKKEEKVAVAA